MVRTPLGQVVIVLLSDPVAVPSVVGYETVCEVALVCAGSSPVGWARVSWRCAVKVRT